MAKQVNTFKVYLERIIKYLYILFISYTVVALLYTTIQIFSGDFRLDLFGYRFQVEQTFISPVEY